MKLFFMPISKIGNYAMWLIVLSVVFIGAIMVVGTGIETPAGNEGFFSNVPLALLALGAFISGIGSFIASVVALTKNKDRSILVWICLLLGALIIYYGIAQIIGEI